MPVVFFNPGRATLTAFESSLRASASFPEKLHQLLDKWSAKRAPGKPPDAPFEFHIRRIRGRF
jgi:hypothetical protein